MLGIGLSLLGVGISLLGISTVSKLVSLDYEQLVFITGVIIVALGGTLIIFWKVRLVYICSKATADYLSRKLSDAFAYEFNDLVFKKSDISDICKLGRKLISNNHADESVLIKRVERNRNIIKAFSDHGNEIRGYYIIYPINKDADSRIFEGKVRNAKSLKESDLTKTIGAASAIYISMLAGEGRHAKALALYNLKRDLRKISLNSKKVKKLYAKPASQDGLRLMKKYGFEPVGGESEIWEANIDQFTA